MDEDLNLHTQLKSASDEITQQYILAQIDQRIQSGFSDQDAANASHYIASILPQILERLASMTDCMPMNYDQVEDWRKHLDHIAEMFRTAHRLEHDGDIDASDRAIRMALAALGESFWDLWCLKGTDHK